MFYLSIRVNLAEQRNPKLFASSNWGKLPLHGVEQKCSVKILQGLHQPCPRVTTVNGWYVASPPLLAAHIDSTPINIRRPRVPIK